MDAVSLLDRHGVVSPPSPAVGNTLRRTRRFSVVTPFFM